jgi:hypothetical protein
MDSEASSTVATQDAHSWNRYSATSPTTPSNPDQSVAGPSRPTTQFEIQTFPWNSIARYVPTTAPPRDNSYEAQGLGKLSDGPDGPQGKAPYSWTVLITHAIMGSPDRRLTLAAIYEAIETRYPWYKTQGTGWKVRRLIIFKRSHILFTFVVELHPSCTFPQSLLQETRPNSSGTRQGQILDRGSR